MPRLQSVLIKNDAIAKIWKDEVEIGVSDDIFKTCGERSR